MEGLGRTASDKCFSIAVPMPYVVTWTSSSAIRDPVRTLVPPHSSRGPHRVGDARRMPNSRRVRVMGKKRGESHGFRQGPNPQVECLERPIGSSRIGGNDQSIYKGAP